MILTVTLNAAIDKTHRIPDFRPGHLHRPGRTWVRAGGKGLNVSRALKTLGEPALATGLVAGHVGRRIEACLGAEGLPFEFERLASGESRTCLAIVGPPGMPPTEINEEGPFISPAAFEAFMGRYDALLARADYVALSGSLPPGLDGDHYGQLIARARARGLGVSLDTSGAALPSAARFAPDVLKPTQAEAEALLGAPLTPESLGEAIESLLALGPRIVGLTLGERGAVVADRHEAWLLEAPRLEAVNAIGSGDTFLATLLSALRRGRPLAEAARWAVAAGSANALLPEPATCSLAEIEALVGAVGIRPLSAAPAAAPRAPS